MKYLYYTGNHTVAVIKGHESYDLLKSSGKDVFSYINKLIDDGNICIDGKEILIDIYLGGDYKVYYFLLRFTYVQTEHSLMEKKEQVSQSILFITVTDWFNFPQISVSVAGFGHEGCNF